ncbi:MAG: TlpA disulfide reductase family protein [Patescibacteria group bacterium]
MISFTPRIKILFSIGAVLLVAIGLFVALSGTREAEVTFFEQVAELSFVDYQGRDVSLETFRGRPLVINSWAAWCPFCREELPDFVRLQEELGDGLVVIAINRKEPRATSQTYTDGLGISDQIVFLLDETDTLYQMIGGFSMPETLFVDGEGNLVVHKRGFMDLEEMRTHTKKLFSK